MTVGNQLTFDGETYRIVMDDRQTLSAVRPEGERKVTVLLIDKATGEVERKTRVAAWLNKTLKEEAT